MTKSYPEVLTSVRALISEAIKAKHLPTEAAMPLAQAIIDIDERMEVRSLLDRLDPPWPVGFRYADGGKIEEPVDFRVNPEYGKPHLPPGAPLRFGYPNLVVEFYHGDQLISVHKASELTSKSLSRLWPQNAADRQLYAGWVKDYDRARRSKTAFYWLFELEDGGQASVKILDADSPVRETHEVEPGEDCMTLAEKHYGHRRFWPVIGVTNGLAEPFNLKAGQSLVIPKIETKVGP